MLKVSIRYNPPVREHYDPDDEVPDTDDIAPELNFDHEDRGATFASEQPVDEWLEDWGDEAPEVDDLPVAELGEDAAREICADLDAIDIMLELDGLTPAIAAGSKGERLED